MSPAKNTYLVIVIVAILVTLLLLHFLQNSGILSEFFELELNAQGDTLAGYIGSLAFVLAAIAILMQSKELSTQRKELKAQREATQEMSKAMNAQIEFFEDERRHRVEKEHSMTLEQRAELVFSIITHYQTSFQLQFEVSDCGLMEADELIEISEHDPTIGRIKFFRAEYMQTNIEARIIAISRDAFVVDSALRKILGADYDFTYKSAYPERLQQIIDAVDDVIELEDKLSSADQARLARMRIKKLRYSLKSMYEKPIWQIGNS